MSLTKSYDVLVIGAGNAGFAAAHAAREHGVSVAVLECSSEEEAVVTAASLPVLCAWHTTVLKN